MPHAGAGNDLQEIGVQTDQKTRWLIALAVLASAIMELVDTSAVNVSLPYIAGNLSSSVEEATSMSTESHLPPQDALRYPSLSRPPGTNSVTAGREALAVTHHNLLQNASALSYLDGFRIRVDPWW